MFREVINIKNYGRDTELLVAGIRLRKCIRGIAFSQKEGDTDNPRLMVKVDIRQLLEEIVEIKPEELEQAKEILKPYLDAFK